MPIVNRQASAEEIRTRLRESPLAALREMLTDGDILAACRDCGHTFRERVYDPIVTVLHYLAQAVQREHSFAATWQELWAPLAADLPQIACVAPDYSALTHARRRLPKAVMQTLAADAVHDTGDLADRWREIWEIWGRFPGNLGTLPGYSVTPCGTRAYMAVGRASLGRRPLKECLDTVYEGNTLYPDAPV
jgi:hypothetical protein